MAPRRGGSSGGGISIASCSSGAFETELSKVYLAFWALYFFVFLILFFTSFVSSRTWRKGHGKLFQPLVWSIVFLMILMILRIVFLVLGQCMITYDGYGVIDSIVMSWVMDLANVLLVGMIMIPLCKELQLANGKVSSAKMMIHKLWFALIVIMAIAADAVTTAWYALTYDVSSSYLEYNDSYDNQRTAQKLQEHIPRLITAYYATVVVGLLLASGVLIAGVAKPSRQSLTPWAILLVIGSLGFSVTFLASFVYNTYGDWQTQDYEAVMHSLEAQAFLQYFFIALAVLGALKTAGALCKPLRASFVGHVQPAAAQPMAPPPAPYEYQSAYHHSPSMSPPPQSYHASSPPPTQQHFQSGFSHEIRAH